MITALSSTRQKHCLRHIGELFIQWDTKKNGRYRKRSKASKSKNHLEDAKLEDQKREELNLIGKQHISINFQDAKNMATIGKLVEIHLLNVNKILVQHEKVRDISIQIRNILKS